MLTSGFYNSKGGDRKYDAEQFGAMFNGLIADGVFAHYKDALKVTAGIGNRELVIKPGRAWFNGTWTEVDDNGHSIYLMGSAVETTYFVYLAINKSDRKNTIAWYSSIMSNIPEKGLYFYLLAQVTIPGGVSKITEAMITDTRGSDLCPYVTGIMETVSFEDIVKRVCGENWKDWLGVYEAGITTGVQNAVATSERALDEVKSMKAYVVESEAVSYIWAKFEAVPTGGGGFEWATDSVHTELSDPPMPMCLFRDLSYADLGPGFKPNIALHSPYIAEGETAVKAIPAITQSKVWREYPYFWEGGAGSGTEVLRYDYLLRVVVNIGGTATEKYRYRVSRLMHIPVTYEPGAYIGTVNADNATAYPRDGYKDGYYYMRFAARAEDVSFYYPGLSAKNVKDAIIEVVKSGSNGPGTAMSVIEVEELPSAGNKGVFYIVKKPGDSDASEYLWLDRWEKIGGTDSGKSFTLTSPNGTVFALAVNDDGTLRTVKQGDDEPGEPDLPDGPVESFTPFRFVQISDSHASNSQPAIGVFVRDINMLTDVDFVTDSGDITLDQSKDDAIKRAELAEYKSTLRDPLNIPIYPCVGGHDLCKSMDTIWPEYTGVERLQEIKHKGCVFLLADCLLSGWLDWLEERVAANHGKRIFVLGHHPIENDEFTVGLKPGETRVTWGDSEMRRILRLLRNSHNVIWFTGHTHWPFKTAVNDVYNDGGRMGAVVHTPYLNAYQGWMVEVGEAATMLRGVEFSESGMRYLGEGYDYAIEQDTTDYGEAEILTEGETVTLGGTVDISVYLAAAPRSSQTVHLIADDGIGIDKTEMVFTPANYATPQTVAVSGNTAGTGKLTLYSRSKTAVRKIDVVDGAAVTNWFNKTKPLTPLGSYYGTGTSASYQLSNLIPAKTGDHVRSNALGSQTTMRLKMFDADFKYIAEAQNNVQAVDYIIAEANVAYVSVVYRGATPGQADTIMVTVNQELPSEYVGYNADPVGYAITNHADPDAPSVVGGYYNASLTQVADDGTNVSNLFAVTSGDTVYTNGIDLDTKPYLYVYDAERTIIERMTIGTGSITNAQAAYAAVCYAADINNLMVMINQMVPGYYVTGTDVM